MSKPRKLWKRLGLATLLTLAAATVAMAALRDHYPVLVHLFPTCACTDDSWAVTGINILNPFRDRSAERAADQFFADLRAGKCPDNATESFKNTCRNTPKERMPTAFDTKLKYIDSSDGRTLYYKLDRKDAPRDYPFVSEGHVSMSRTDPDAAFRIDDFEVIW